MGTNLSKDKAECQQRPIRTNVEMFRIRSSSSGQESLFLDRAEPEQSRSRRNTESKFSSDPDPQLRSTADRQERTPESPSFLMHLSPNHLSPRQKCPAEQEQVVHWSVDG